MASSWLGQFLLTLAIEVPLLVLLTRASRTDLGRRLLLAVFANLATHPVVWYVFPDLPIDFVWSLLLSEAWATATEAVFYRVVLDGLGWTRATLVSLAANGASFGAGLAWYLFGG
jgi:hypothetical protein